MTPSFRLRLRRRCQHLKLILLLGLRLFGALAFGLVLLVAPDVDAAQAVTADKAAAQDRRADDRGKDDANGLSHVDSDGGYTENVVVSNEVEGQSPLLTGQNWLRDFNITMDYSKN